MITTNQVMHASECPTFPSEFKYMAATAVMTGGTSQTFSFASPGAFCPYKMIISVRGSVGQIASLLVTSIKVGIENQILSGSIPARLFSIDNNCCPIACLRCICSPGVHYDVTLFNGNGTITVTVSLFGFFKDACAPGFISSPWPEFFGCPTPGSDKLVGFTTGLLAFGQRETIEVTTPGKFCPRQMFLDDSAAVYQIEGIRVGINDQIISGIIPSTLFSADNSCCVLSCLDCLCMPGVPLLIDVQAGASEGSTRLHGALIGTYLDVCP